MPEDPSATYRGFRNQALYILHRLLTDGGGSERIYRPEGAEDLAVFDSRMRLVEVVQVKDHSSDLTLSSLKPKSAEGFFARLSRRRHEHPDCITKLASFGPLGPELGGSIAGDASHRAKLVEKLCGSNIAISAVVATAMLEGLKGHVIHPIEAELRASVMDALRGTNVAADLESSVELLMYWVFDASEKQRDLTRQGLLVKLESIGRYLVALRDSSAEWGVSVFPVRALALTLEEAARWTAEYRRGVQARWEHIVSGADCHRTGRLQEVHKRLQQRPVVVIRGASGQGKSTLGWRYLHDFCAEGLRFHVHLVEGREHAMRIANALGEHVKRLNLKAVAYLDVSPNDAGWSELVRELVSAGISVLIAVREEDFRRANIAVGDFDYSEVVLDRVTREEAEPIFTALRAASVVTALDFEEAWARFASEEGGPLLEFTHLVSEGESLTSRIAAQIRRIQNDALANAHGLTEAHLELLALAAVANETGARVSLAQLCDAVGVNLLAAPLKALENEFLLRVQDEGAGPSVAGLHALRSRAIVSALFADAPGLWEKYAAQVIPLIVDEDIEGFLLAAFSRKPEFSTALFEELAKLAPRSWTHAACITRSLLWEGVSRYELRNRDAILGAMAKYDSGWWFVCDSFVGTRQDTQPELLEMVNDALKADVQSVPLTPKEEIFDLFAAWAVNAPAPAPPQHPLEWASAGDIAHWLGHTDIGGPMRAAIEKLVPSPLPEKLHVEELGVFVSGRARLGDANFSAWHNSERQAITNQFLRETDSVHVADDGREAKVFFSVPLAVSVTEGMSDADDWHGQTMKRVRLLRLLFPNRDTYGAQGLGVEIFVEQVHYDPTFKQIPAKSLPDERSVRLNAIFGNLVAYRHSRAETWNQYASAVLTFREAVSGCFRKLHRGWAKLLSESTPRPNTIKQMPGAEIDRVNKLSKLPMFPRNTVDEWGFISEEKQEKRIVAETMQQRSLRRFDAWRKAFRDFEMGIGMVTSNIINLTALYVAEHKGHLANDEDDKSGHLLLVNLGASWRAMRRMQEEFRARFGGLFRQQQLDELEAHEQSNFRHLWAVAFAMRYERQQHRSNIAQMVETDIERRRSRFLQTLKAEVNAALGDFGTAFVRETAWFFDGNPHLCIVSDHRSLNTVEATLPKVVEAVWRAAQSGGWRDLEWKPLEVEWPKIALVNLVCGKALVPACATISTMVLFASSEAFEVKPHHYTALPVKQGDFARGGFRVWQSPLLRATLALQGNVLAFVVTHTRFYHLANLILEQELQQEAADRILAGFGTELRTVMTVAQRSYTETLQILAATDSDEKARWTEELNLSCRSLLFEVDENASVSLTLETFVSWADRFQSVLANFQETISEMVAFALKTGAGE